MPAPKGNKYNEIWSEKKALVFMNDSLRELINDSEIMYIGTLAIRMNQYRDLYMYLVDKFEKKNKDFRTIKNKIDSIIETRLFDAALKNKVNSTVAIFGLKNNHDWRDKTEHINKNIEVTPDLSEENIKRIDDILNNDY